MSSRFRIPKWGIAPCAAMLLALACLPQAACKRAEHAVADAAIEGVSGGKVKIARDGNRTTISTDQGEMAMQAGDALPLPKDFPGDVYLPRGYRVNSVMDMGGLQVISLQAQGKVAGLFADARDVMAKQGWKQTMAMQNAADTAMLSFEKEKRAAVLSFNEGQDAQDVTMNLQLRQEGQ
jgi:hypothetical protein